MNIAQQYVQQQLKNEKFRYTRLEEKAKLDMKQTHITRYPAYKDSGVEWLGEIPSFWSLIRGNYIFEIVNERSKRGEEELLSVSEHHGVKPRSVSNVNMFMAESYKGYKLCFSGDLVINSLWAWSRGLGISDYDGIVSTAYSVFRPDYTKYNKSYLDYLLRIEEYIAQYLIVSKGIWISRLQLSDWNFLRILILTPPLEEQTRIANFLDRKTAQIDSAIAQKEQLITLLHERRQILIHNAVTRGLNPDVPMKESGVEWIGEIPAHWEVKRAKHVFYEVDERSQHGEEELLSVSHMTGVTPRSEKNISMFKAEDYTGSKLCRKGDLVFNIMWAWMGALGVSDREGIVSPSYGVYRQRNCETFNPWYLEHLLRSINYVTHYNRVSTGLHSSRLRFYSHMFFDMKLAIPPREEQEKIASHSINVSSKIETAITQQQAQIDKLKEYKATLINSAVTGKIKV